MNNLLIFFAFPVATIILAAVLQTILRCPIAVAATFFAVFLVITFAFFDANFLIATIVYTILAFISAALTRTIENLLDRLNNNTDSNNGCGCGCNSNGNDENTSCGCNREVQEPINYVRRGFYRCG